MKWLKTTASVMLIFAPMAGSALAADGVLFKQEATPESYCHLKFPAIRPSTLGSDHPELKSPASGDTIDYYGPCEESPTGRDQVIKQQQDEELRFDRNYEG